jgi:hypothetical protein
VILQPLAQYIREGALYFQFIFSRVEVELSVSGVDADERRSARQTTAKMAKSKVRASDNPIELIVKAILQEQLESAYFIFCAVF